MLYTQRNTNLQNTATLGNYQRLRKPFDSEALRHLRKNSISYNEASHSNNIPEFHIFWQLEAKTTFLRTRGCSKQNTLRWYRCAWVGSDCNAGKCGKTQIRCWNRCKGTLAGPGMNTAGVGNNKISSLAVTQTRRSKVKSINKNLPQELGKYFELCCVGVVHVEQMTGQYGCAT